MGCQYYQSDAGEEGLRDGDYQCLGTGGEYLVSLFGIHCYSVRCRRGHADDLAQEPVLLQRRRRTTLRQSHVTNDRFLSAQHRLLRADEDRLGASKQTSQGILRGYRSDTSTVHVVAS